MGGAREDKGDCRTYEVRSIVSTDGGSSTSSSSIAAVSSKSSVNVASLMPC